MTETTAAPPLKAGALKRLFGTLHLWIGVIIGIPAAILGITGIALMLTHPLPATVGPASYAPVASIDRVVAAARAMAPDGATPQQFDAAPAGKPAVVRFLVPRTDNNPRGLVRVQVDPATLAVTPSETQTPLSTARVVHDLHGSFMMGRDGRQLVGWVGVFMCGLSITGIVLWWPRRGKWRAAFTVSGKGSTVMVLREIHGAAGIWGLIVFFIISMTGVLVAFPSGGSGGAEGDAGYSRERRAEAPMVYRADAAVALAAAKLSGYVLRAVALPRNDNDPYIITLVRIGDDRAVPPMTVTVDNAASEIVSVHNTAAEARAWARPVHTGGGMGWVWWVLTLLSGVLPVIFAISGIWMWLLKRRSRARIAALS